MRCNSYFFIDMLSEVQIWCTLFQLNQFFFFVCVVTYELKLRYTLVSQLNFAVIHLFQAFRLHSYFYLLSYI